jgi:hypothetical protein
MHYVALAVVCSVAVSLLLKFAPALRVDLQRMVLWNYLAAAALCWGLLHPHFDAASVHGAPLLLALVLGVLLPSLFVAMGRAAQTAGIWRADAAQRLSLLLSLAAAFTLFGETPQTLKVAGLALGLLAMLGILARPADAAAPRGAFGWLLAVWFGYAAVDVLFKLVALRGGDFVDTLQLSFGLAFVVMGVAQLLRRARFDARSIIAGLVLGALNFANIDFYIRAHQALHAAPAVVFASMNIGVVALSAVAGIGLLGERTSRLNRWALLPALAAIGLLARAAG